VEAEAAGVADPTSANFVPGSGGAGPSTTPNVFVLAAQGATAINPDGKPCNPPGDCNRCVAAEEGDRNTGCTAVEVYASCLVAIQDFCPSSVEDTECLGGCVSCLHTYKEVGWVSPCCEEALEYNDAYQAYLDQLNGSDRDKTDPNTLGAYIVTVSTAMFFAAFWINHHLEWQKEKEGSSGSSQNIFKNHRRDKTMKTLPPGLFPNGSDLDLTLDPKEKPGFPSNSDIIRESSL